MLKDESRNKRKFWVVWNPRGYIPMNRHDTEQSAIDEAERLAQKHPNHHIYVLENVGYSLVEKPDTFRYAEESPLSCS